MDLDETVIRYKVLTEGKSRERIAQEMSISLSSICRFCNKNNIPRSHLRLGGRLDLRGKRFGFIEVLEETGEKSVPQGSMLWKCFCHYEGCEKTVVMSAAQLMRQKVKKRPQTCGCYSRQIQFKGHGELSYCYFDKLKRQASKKGREFNLDMSYLWDLFLKQNRLCALSGIPLSLGRGHYTKKRWSQTASLDRIDSTKGYIKGNVQWLHKYVNLMKKDKTDREFIDWCCKIALWNDDPVSNPAPPRSKVIVEST